MIDGPSGMERLTKKKVMLLSYRMREPGENGRRDMILVVMSASETSKMDTYTSSPLKRATIVNKSVVNNKS